MKKISIALLIYLQISLLAGDLLFASVVIDDRSYKATITRDVWGVPHVFGKTDADAAFGMAFAHAQDDIKNLTDNISLYRAEMGLKQGLKGVVSDYLIKALKIREMVAEGYEAKLSSQVREVIEGYVLALTIGLICIQTEIIKHCFQSQSTILFQVLLFKTSFFPVW